MIFKNQNCKTEVSSFPFQNLQKVRKCVNLLYIKCQDLKKRFSIKYAFILSLHVTEFLKSLKLNKNHDCNIFYNLFPTVNIYAFEKYYLTVCLYLKVSHSKSYKTIQHCLFPCFEGKITSLYQSDTEKQHGLLFLLSEGSLPFPHVPLYA